jgi:hypothetical protein
MAAWFTGAAFRCLRSKRAYAAYAFVRVFINTALPYTFGKAWEQTLRAAPIALSVAFAVIGLRLLRYQISKMLSEVKNYAAAQ